MSKNQENTGEKPNQSTHSSTKIVQNVMLAVGMGILAQNAQAETLTELGIIREVVVYPQQAEVVRQVRLNVPTGEHTLRIAPLPAELNGETVRVALQGNAVIGAVEVRTINTEASSAGRQRELEAQLEAIQDERRILEEKIVAAKLQIQFLQSQAQINSKDGKVALSPSDWQAALGILSSAGLSAQKEIREAERAQRDLDRKINKIRADLNQVRTGDARQQREVLVQIVSRSAQTVQADVRYQMPQVRWTPQYRLQLNSETGNVNIALRAELEQKTGEDWTSAKIFLATNQPNTENQPPSITPWVVNLLPPIEAFGYGGKGAMQKRAMANMVQAPMPAAAPMPIMEESADTAAEAMPEAEIAYAATFNSSFNTRYQLNGLVNVPADGQGRLFEILSLTIPAKLNAVIVPRQDETAYVQAEFNYPTDTLLPPGLAELYRDQDFIGKTDLPESEPGKPVLLGFGRDAKVAVKFKALPEKNKQTGVFSREQNIARRYEVRVQNLHTTPMQIKVRDHLPVSSNEQLKVTPYFAENSKPSDVAEDRAEGLLVWRWEAAAQSVRTLEYGFDVVAPADGRIGGL